MRKKWFSDRRQISVLSDCQTEFKQFCRDKGISIKEIANTQNHVVWEYCDKGGRKEELLYAIKEIYENELKA